MADWKAYYLVARNTWDETFTYRLNFFVWRLRVVLQLLTTYFLWATILVGNKTFAGYNNQMMLTYILGTAVLSAVVMSTRTQTVADDIVQGDLSNYLIRPLNYFWYYFSKDVGDKAMNIAFSVVEFSIILLVLHPPLFIQTNPITLFLFIMSTIFAVVLNFYFNMALSFIGFWSSEVWAPRFIFYILLIFFAGGLFPLNILPKPLFIIMSALPFPYLLYGPMKIYLGQMTQQELLVTLGVSFVWMFGMAFLVGKLWRKGIKLYSAEGR